MREEHVEPLSPAEQAAGRRILDQAGRVLGVDLSRYQQQLLLRRVVHRSREVGVGTLSAYESWIAERPGEERELARRLLIRTTSLFRGRAFGFLRDDALSGLMRRRMRERATALRAWVVGCASGEEAYSLAMCLLEAKEATGAGVEVSVLGSDLDAPSLAAAARGILRARPGGPVPEALGRRWLGRHPEGLEVLGAARAAVSFVRHDLLNERQIAPREAVLASFDVISCCNVLMYLNEEVRRRALERLVGCCEPGGLVALGDAEQAYGTPSLCLEPLEPGCPVFRYGGPRRREPW